MTPTAHAVAAFQRAGSPKKLVSVMGGHFDVYTGAGFDIATSETIGWLKAHLAEGQIV